jgi:hypothetical protein
MAGVEQAMLRRVKPTILPLYAVEKSAVGLAINFRKLIIIRSAAIRD